MSAGCVNRQLFADTFAITTKNYDDMSIMYLQLVSAAIGGKKFILEASIYFISLTQAENLVNDFVRFD